jgi:hypothetical protein
LRWVTAALLYRACDSAADAEDGYVCVVCIEGAEYIGPGECKGCRELRGAYIDVSTLCAGDFVPENDMMRQDKGSRSDNSEYEAGEHHVESLMKSIISRNR